MKIYQVEDRAFDRFKIAAEVLASRYAEPEKLNFYCTNCGQALYHPVMVSRRGVELVAEILDKMEAFYKAEGMLERDILNILRDIKQHADDEATIKKAAQLEQRVGSTSLLSRIRQKAMEKKS